MGAAAREACPTPPGAIGLRLSNSLLVCAVNFPDWTLGFESCVFCGFRGSRAQMMQLSGPAGGANPSLCSCPCGLKPNLVQTMALISRGAADSLESSLCCRASFNSTVLLDRLLVSLHYFSLTTKADVSSADVNIISGFVSAATLISASAQQQGCKRLIFQIKLNSAL